MVTWSCPRGLLDVVTRFASEAGSKVDVEDKRTVGRATTSDSTPSSALPSTPP